MAAAVLSAVPELPMARPDRARVVTCRGTTYDAVSSPRTELITPHPHTPSSADRSSPVSVTWLLGADGRLVATPAFAVTVNVYGCPMARPETSADVAVASVVTA